MAERDEKFRDNLQTVTIDGFAGYATAVDRTLPKAIKVMDLFHVVHLAAAKLTGCRQRLQQETCGRRGRKQDPLYRNRRALLTRTEFLTEKSRKRLDRPWATDDDYVALQVTWLFYQDLIHAYAQPDQRRGKRMMRRVIDALRRGLPAGLEELAQLGRTLWSRRHDILAYF